MTDGCVSAIIPLRPALPFTSELVKRVSEIENEANDFGRGDFGFLASRVNFGG